MRVSWNWLDELIDLPSISGGDALSELLTQRGLEVEAWTRQDRGFEKVVVGQILKKERHPQADRLNLCLVECGLEKPLEIVCGAQNMKEGDKVAVAQVGAHLPNDLKITESKIRGVVSHGMLCSEEELKLKDQSEGILILPEESSIGQPVAQVLGLADSIFTLKITANRADCLSHFGMARELGAALGKKPKEPKRYDLSNCPPCPVQVHLEAKEQVLQFHRCTLEGVKVGPSPSWLIKRLESLGVRSVSNVVDATNWVMLELGNPLHAFDLDQLNGKHLFLRLGKPGENLKLLDGQTIGLTEKDLVIADSSRALSLAGIMGGAESEISDQTTKVLIECAEFEPQGIRRSSNRFQIKTDGSYRFERGVDPKGQLRAMERVVYLILELAGGKVTGYTGEHYSPALSSSSSSSQIGLHPVIQLDPGYVSRFLGVTDDQPPFTHEKMIQILQALDCQVDSSKEVWAVTPPSYRRDLVIAEDLIEEVARIVGYDHIPSELPVLTSSPVAPVSERKSLEKISRAKNSLVQSGICETIHLSFTSRKWMRQFNLPEGISVVNPMSEDQELMVSSLLPNLIQKALTNWNHHFGSESLAIRLFELRPTFHGAEKTRAIDKKTTSVEERWKLSFLISGPRLASGLKKDLEECDFYDVKGVMEKLLSDLGIRGARFLPLSETYAKSKSAIRDLFHPGKSVEVLTGNASAGLMGSLHPKIAKALKTRSDIWMTELDWAILSERATDTPLFKPWPDFPSIERDFALLVKNPVRCEKLCQIALKAGKPLVKGAKIFDVYQGSQVAQGMTSVAVRVIFYEPGRSITEAEAEAASAQIILSWEKELGARLRG